MGSCARSHQQWPVCKILKLNAIEIEILEFSNFEIKNSILEIKIWCPLYMLKEKTIDESARCAGEEPLRWNFNEVDKEIQNRVCWLDNNRGKVFKEKARVSWLQYGDRNNAFFHRKVRAHNAGNKILSLYDEEGTHVTYYEEVKKLLLIIIKTSLNIDKGNEGLLTSWSCWRRDKTSLLDMQNEKTHGLDGFTAKFFKQN